MASATLADACAGDSQGDLCSNAAEISEHDTVIFPPRQADDDDYLFSYLFPLFSPRISVGKHAEGDLKGACFS